ncbi:N-acetylmuramoyl-L-alanine amidase [Ignatzschineria rhizosphaerae]|uniref:N-acetylmuramoyl-L-alanine amidase n=1 Tax=Ignatzschineria rhizosphaerae TaxID=2923279 RepID=UPI0022CF1A8F|nr:N-acetylmuramoyl-L-alanine amidase [Ignatzschineria rhizosphaerae]
MSQTKLQATQTARKIDKLIVHCSATPENRNNTIDDVRRWHKAEGYRDIGYHYVIHLDGSIHKGRAEAEVGAHVKSHNKYSIGVCYIGGVDAQMNPKDTRTPAQKKALIKILKELKAKYPNATIHGHREFANKACPSFDATTEYADLVPDNLVLPEPAKERKKSFWDRLREWLRGGETGEVV